MSEMDWSSWRSNDDFSDITNEHAAVEIPLEEYWLNEDGNYGLQDLFYEKESSVHNDNEAEEIEQLILKKTKNKLYEIFVQQCGTKEPKKRGQLIKTGALVTPGKRKTLSQPESPEGDPTRAACRKTPKLLHMSPPRFRLQTVSNIKHGMTAKQKNKRRTKSLARNDPSQRLLTQLWNNNVRALNEEE